MNRIAYMVVAHCPNPDPPDLADQYMAWLAPGHTDLVLPAGASEVRVVRLDSPGEAGEAAASIETQYIFPDRGAFDRYLAKSAPALRAEGFARLLNEQAASLGIRFERRSGEVV